MAGSGEGSSTGPSGDAVELWYIDLEALSAPLRALETECPLLTDDERASEAAAAPGSVHDATRWTARRALRLLLTRVFGEVSARTVFQTGVHGKPAVAGLPGDFNVAHSATSALIGVGRVTAIGVDLETPRLLRLSDARRAAMVAAGLRIAEGAPLPDEEDARTLQAWARLEALAKADGTGIGRTLARLGIWGRPAASDTPAAEHQAGHEEAFTIYDVAVAAGHYAAVALPRGIRAPAVRYLPADRDLLRAIRAGASLPPNSGVDLAPAPRQKGPVRSVAQPG